MHLKVFVPPVQYRPLSHVVPYPPHKQSYKFSHVRIVVTPLCVLCDYYDRVTYISYSSTVFTLLLLLDHLCARGKWKFYHSLRTRFFFIYFFLKELNRQEIDFLYSTLSFKMRYSALVIFCTLCIENVIETYVDRTQKVNCNRVDASDFYYKFQRSLNQSVEASFTITLSHFELLTIGFPNSDEFRLVFFSLTLF